MLKFRSVALSDKESIEKYTAMINSYLCEHCFVDMFIWCDHYNTEVCFTDEFLFVRCESFPDKVPMYLAPIGKGDIKKAVELIEEDAKLRNIEFIMVSISEQQLPLFEEIIGDRYDFEWSEDSADYIYLSEKMQTLSGKKLQSKRNLVNRFNIAHQDKWRYEDITKENKHLAHEYHLKWCAKNGCEFDNSFLGETCAVNMALNNFEALNMRGGLLFLNDEVIAYTLGCKVHDDLFVMQIEKAEAEIDGAYQMINQQFVLRNCTDVMYINREEDLGLDGLRKAKLSYKPEMIGKKYFTKIKGHL